jgi:hypothetical protein
MASVSTLLPLYIFLEEELRPGHRIHRSFEILISLFELAENIHFVLTVEADSIVMFVDSYRGEGITGIGCLCHLGALDRMFDIVAAAPKFIR